MIKAIETFYNGYRFRSRLEARWAVFFDTLGVKYEYEKEGFDLDGIYYLPDFWLPEQNCWIEIKGDDVSDKEAAKTSLLALHGGKNVYTFVGSIPLTNDDIRGWMIEGVNVAVVNHHTPERLMDGSREIIVTLMKIFRLGVTIHLSDKKGFFTQTHAWISGFSFDNLLHEIENQHEELKKLFDILKKYEDTFLEYLHYAYVMQPQYSPAIDFEVIGGATYTENYWFVCNSCKKVGISPYNYFHTDDCIAVRNSDGSRSYTRTESSFNSYDILNNAYIAARQARFEHGEKP